MINDTFHYLLDMFTIDNPGFQKYIPNLYQMELQLNKENTLDKETSYRQLSRLSGDVFRLQSYIVYIFQLVRFAKCCTSVSDFHSKILQINSNLLTQGNSKIQKN